MGSPANELQYPGLVTKVLEYPRLVSHGEIQAVFYGSDKAMMLKGLLAELLFGNTWGITDICTKR